MKAITSSYLWQFINLGKLQVFKNRVIFLSVKADNDHKKNTYLWTLNTLDQGNKVSLANFDFQPNFVFKDENNAYFVNNNELDNIELNSGTISSVLKLKTKSKMTVVKKINNNLLLLTGLSDKLTQDNENYTILDEVPAYFNGQGLINKKRTHLFLLDLKQAKLTDLNPDPLFNVYNFYLNKKSLYFTGAKYNHVAPIIPALYQINLTDLKVKEILTKNKASLGENALFCLNKQIFLLTSGKDLDTNPQFYKLNTDNNLNLAAQWDHSIGSFMLVTDQAMIEGSTTQVFENKFYFDSPIVDHSELFTFNGQKVKPFFQFDGNIDYFRITGKNEFYFIGMAANKTQKLYQFKNGKIKVLYDPNKELLKDAYVAKVHQINYTATHDSKQHGWVLYPKDYDKTKKYPAILEIHGGPRAAYGKVFFHEMQMLASEGYFVFFCNIHGSEGQGNKFANIRGHWGEDDYQDLMLFTNQVLKDIPQIDKNHLGVTGGSYGGYMTNWIIGHTNCFKAAVSERSLSNNISHFYISDIGVGFTDLEMGSKPTENPASYWKQSPLAYVQNVKTPTLFIHSDEDWRCPLPEGLQMFRGVLLNGVESELFLIHGENHELSRSGSPLHRIQRLNAVSKWFNKYLK